jgi:hypothetical protein
VQVTGDLRFTVPVGTCRLCSFVVQFCYGATLRLRLLHDVLFGCCDFILVRFVVVYVVCSCLGIL